MKAFLVVDFSMRDWPGFLDYVAAIPAFIARHGGRYVVQGVEPSVVEGDWAPERLVILEFPARENAEAFLADPEVQPLFAIRQRATVSKLVIVDELRS